jgi:uncharacterized Zn finger protein
MAKPTRTWWGQRFIEALESFTDPGRLQRGRSYAGPHRIKSHTLNNGEVTAKVRGNVNPYFGVYKEPMYKTTLTMKPIPAAQWSKLVKHFASRADTLARLLMNEMPDDIEDAFEPLGLRLLPRGQKDFQTDCSCPDWGDPCKHVAGVCYMLAAQLDQDPFLLFELRGLSRDKLRQELAKTPLGKTLAAALGAQNLPPEPVESYFTRPRSVEIDNVGYDSYWHADKRLPTQLEPLPPAGGLAAILIRKGGDYPPFWNKDHSFIEVMAELYERIRKKNEVLS